MTCSSLRPALLYGLLPLLLAVSGGLRPDAAAAPLRQQAAFDTTAALPSLPPVTPSARLWTRWWWMGSAVTPEGLTTHLEAFRAAGLGGASIVPIYGVEGREADFLPYLGDAWLDALMHTVREAERLGLSVDMTLGTGWPYGGPWLDVHQSPHRYDPATQQGVPTGQQVKRAAPGAEGPVLDPFSAAALDAFLARYEAAFAAGDVPADMLRAFFNDSYEVYGANWTPGFLDAFAARRGYDLTPYLPLLFDSVQTDTAVRVRSDYHETLADLLLEHFAVPWAAWCRAHGALARYQAHGSPGNLLDLYAAADIPETEAFGPAPLDLPGVRVDADYDVARFGQLSPLAFRFASSAAHVAGRRLASSETATWLGEHFRVALSQVKPQVDLLFASGINHVLLHGIPYSPADAPYPGWLFYASTHFGPTSTLWHDLPALAGYVARVQSLLQASRPGTDVLLYFPIYDVWQEPGTSDGTHPLSVHNLDAWLLGTPFGDVAERLAQRGYAFDYVSDRQLRGLTVTAEGALQAAGHTYRAVVVPPVDVMPVATLQALHDLARAGAAVVFLDRPPQDVPGLYEHEARQAAAAAFRQDLPAGAVVPADALAPALAAAGVRREALADHGLHFTRRRHDGGTLYFVANLGRRFDAGWVTLGTSAASVELLDPLTGRRGLAATQRDSAGVQVYLALAPGQSVLVRTFDAPVAGPRWAYAVPAGPPEVLSGPWTLTFLEGGPALPEDAELDALASWTALGGAARDFAGRARYRLRFAMPGPPADTTAYLLDLGTVRETARVRLNGHDLGTAWSLPFRLRVPPGVLQAENELEVDVTNLPANQIAALDRDGVRWKTFYDINFVSIRYEPFDASVWPPEPSGLLGPVALQPVRLSPQPPR